MAELIVFAGTSEGREMTEFLYKKGRNLLACVATEYGEEMLAGLPDEMIHRGRLDADGMMTLIRGQKAETVVDATHPYAVEVSKNIRMACEETGVRYLRLDRSAAEDDNGREIEKLSHQEDRADDEGVSGQDQRFGGENSIVRVGSIREAAACLAAREGKALITTGSRELEPFREVPGYRERLTVRVLPSAESIAACRAVGFDGKHIIAMQGPFSEEMNALMLKETGASWLVTKESGTRGGFPEKLAAAKRTGAKIILVSRPPEKRGHTFREIMEILSPEKEDESETQQVYLIGAGMGAPSLLTGEAKHAIRKADVVIGSERLIRQLDIEIGEGKPTFVCWESGKILAFLEEHPAYRTAAILLSGDTGFYSGARKLTEILEEKGEGHGRRVEILCGISSVQYFCAKCRIPWEEVHLTSIHGRQANLAAAVRRHRLVFVLGGGKASVQQAMSGLAACGYGRLTVRAGVNLSNPGEKIFETTVERLAEEAPEDPAVFLLENAAADRTVVTHGIPDQNFLRGDVPMTKEEVRSAVLSKLRLTENAVVYDVGAGTGSVAVEAALQAWRGKVFAIERKADAAELIRENARRFGVTNLDVISGEAPEILAELPAPTHVFIGGSGGGLSEICDRLREKNPAVRIVAAAVTLETMAALTDYLKIRSPQHVEVTQISAARGRTVGGYHLMNGMNPVLLAAFDFV